MFSEISHPSLTDSGHIMPLRDTKITSGWYPQHLRVASSDFGLTITPSMTKSACCLLTVVVSLHIHHSCYGGARDQPMLQIFLIPSLDSLPNNTFPDTTGVAGESIIPSTPVDLEVDTSDPPPSPSSRVSHIVCPILELFSCSLI